MPTCEIVPFPGSVSLKPYDYPRSGPEVKEIPLKSFNLEYADMDAYMTGVIGLIAFMRKMSWYQKLRLLYLLFTNWKIADFDSWSIFFFKN